MSLDHSSPLARTLACVAIEPGLRSALLFDSSPVLLHAAADYLRALLDAVRGQRTEVLTFGPGVDEDELWGTRALDRRGDGPSFVVHQGLLVQSEASGPRILLIPSLARLSLPAARACVALMDADVANLQRYGQAYVWKPDLFWLASCARAEVGEISPHLLDRFAVRLSEAATPTVDRVAAIEAWVLHADGDVSPSMPTAVPEAARVAISRGAQQGASLAAGARAGVLSYVSTQSPVGLRRELALARLSRAVARLDGNGVVTPAHVDEAAALVDLRRASRDTLIQPQPFDRRDANPSEAASPSLARSIASRASSHVELPTAALPDTVESTDGTSVSIPVSQPDTQAAFPASSLPIGPYPEDQAAVARDPNSLKIPPHAYRPSMAAEGPIIGTQRASNLRDLAIVSTILEAAKFQKVRRVPPPARAGDRQVLSIQRADLRSYRRAATPEQLLVIVLDYTCLQDCAWDEALIPHLSWAYTTRASICLVKVGSVSALNHLRAEQILVRNLLSPRLAAALDERHGNATPLAHGLDLAMHTLGTMLEHGRNRVAAARMVVLSDGRGNVPLEASLGGALTRSVSREGVEDALRVAGALRRFKHVQAIVLNPRPQQHPDLPLELADALGATIEEIRLRDRAGSTG